MITIPSIVTLTEENAKIKRFKIAIVSLCKTSSRDTNQVLSTERFLIKLSQLLQVNSTKTSSMML